MDQTVKKSIIDRLNQANNVLVTVKNNPSVDELAACIGFTLFLNKIGKHATAVFSGDVPSTLEFLQPEETLEKNTDSLRDFIISLDKAKADKLRYKVEDKVVKIFITPYQTSLGQEDLEFSQGDFNVDAVVALGAHTKEDLDKAIVAHGRILHDATIITINNSEQSNLGTLNLTDQQASSVSEVVVDISESLQPDQFDTQTATALLTGIVAETARFSNDKTSPRTMTLSAKLMAAGANQQLIATKLQPDMVAGGQKISAKPTEKDSQSPYGTLKIAHNDETEDTQAKTEQKPEPDVSLPQPQPEQTTSVKTPETDTSSAISPAKAIGDNAPSTPGDQPDDQAQSNQSSTNMTFSPPKMGGTLTASSQTETNESPVNPLNEQKNEGSTLQHGQAAINRQKTIPTSDELKGATLSDIQNKVNNYDQKTLNDIEQSIGSPHAAQSAQSTPEPQTSSELANDDTPPDLDAARQAVEVASTDSTPQPSPLQSVGSQPIDLGNQPSQPQLNDQVGQPAQQSSNSSMPDFMVDDNQGAPTGQQPPAAPMPATAPTPPSAPMSPAGDDTPVAPPVNPVITPSQDDTSAAPMQPPTPTENQNSGKTPPPPVPPPMMPPSQ